MVARRRHPRFSHALVFELVADIYREAYWRMPPGSIRTANSSLAC